MFARTSPPKRAGEGGVRAAADGGAGTGPTSIADGAPAGIASTLRPERVRLAAAAMLKEEAELRQVSTKLVHNVLALTSQSFSAMENDKQLVAVLAEHRIQLVHSHDEAAPVVEAPMLNDLLPTRLNCSGGEVREQQNMRERLTLAASIAGQGFRFFEWDAATRLYVHGSTDRIGFTMSAGGLPDGRIDAEAWGAAVARIAAVELKTPGAFRKKRAWRQAITMLLGLALKNGRKGAVLLFTDTWLGVVVLEFVPGVDGSNDTIVVHTPANGASVSPTRADGNDESQVRMFLKAVRDRACSTTPEAYVQHLVFAFAKLDECMKRCIERVHMPAAAAAPLASAAAGAAAPAAGAASRRY